MKKVINIAIYCVIIIVVFLLFGSMFKKCGSDTASMVSETTDHVKENIEEAGEKIVATAEEVADEFEGDEIDYSSDNSEPDYTSSEGNDEANPQPKYIPQDDEPDYTTPDPEPETTYTPPPVKEDPPVRSSGSSSGDYLLVAGNYSQEGNADKMVKQLIRIGFNNAEKVIFDGSRYYTVIAGRYGSGNAANSAQAQLTGSGVDCYVQKKRL